MADLLRGETPRGEADGGGEESRWLLDRAPPGAFGRERPASRITPLMVRDVAEGLLITARAGLRSADQGRYTSIVLSSLTPPCTL